MPNCLLGLHRNYDDPKVSNLERSRERERNGISLRWSGACPLSEANATDKSGHLGDHFVGPFENTRRLPIGVHASSSETGNLDAVGGFDSRAKTLLATTSSLNNT